MVRRSVGPSITSLNAKKALVLDCAHGSSDWWRGGAVVVQERSASNVWVTKLVIYCSKHDALCDSTESIYAELSDEHQSKFRSFHTLID